MINYKKMADLSLKHLGEPGNDSCKIGLGFNKIPLENLASNHPDFGPLPIKVFVFAIEFVRGTTIKAWVLPDQEFNSKSCMITAYVNGASGNFKVGRALLNKEIKKYSSRLSFIPRDSIHEVMLPIEIDKDFQRELQENFGDKDEE